MFWGSFNISVGVVVLVLLVAFWKPVTSKVLLWVFVIVTFPFAALWKGVERLAGIDGSGCAASDVDAKEITLKRRWLMKKFVIAMAGFLLLFAISVWVLMQFDIYDWGAVGWLSLAAFALTAVLFVGTKIFDPPKTE